LSAQQPHRFGRSLPVNHHGFNLSNSKAFVDALHPRVAIMDNGAHKAGSPEAWQTVHESPGLEDLWMLHTAEGFRRAHNSAEPLIANLKGGTDGNCSSGRVGRWQLFSDQRPHRPDQNYRFVENFGSWRASGQETDAFRLKRKRKKRVSL